LLCSKICVDFTLIANLHCKPTGKIVPPTPEGLAPLRTPAPSQASGVMDDEAKPSLATRIHRHWPACVVGFGLLATLVWIVMLGLMLYQALAISLR
jgi:hypothetical protein